MQDCTQSWDTQGTSTSKEGDQRKCWETNSASEDEDTTRQQPRSGEVDLNEDEPAPCGTKKGRFRMIKEKETQGSQVSLPGRSPRSSTANSKNIRCDENAPTKTNHPTKEAPRAITYGNTLMTKHTDDQSSSEPALAVPNNQHQLPPTVYILEQLTM